MKGKAQADRMELEYSVSPNAWLLHLTLPLECSLILDRSFNPTTTLPSGFYICKMEMQYFVLLTL